MGLDHRSLWTAFLIAPVAAALLPAAAAHHYCDEPYFMYGESSGFSYGVNWEPDCAGGAVVSPWAGAGARTSANAHVCVSYRLVGPWDVACSSIHDTMLP